MASDMYLDQLEDVLRFSMPKGKIGALFAESIQVYTYYFIYTSLQSTLCTYT